MAGGIDLDELLVVIITVISSSSCTTTHDASIIIITGVTWGPFFKFPGRGGGGARG